MKQEIIDTYSKNFTGAQDIYKKLKKKCTLQQIKDVLKNIDTNQIIGKKQENKHLSIPISAPLGSFQTDLIFYNQFKRQNHGYSVLLTVIEINTRFAYVYPLKNKKAESILECLEDLLNKEKDNFKSISFDAGSEFENKLVKNFLEKNKIRLIQMRRCQYKDSTEQSEKKYQIFYKQKNYVDDLPKLVNQYNSTEHSEIKITPQKAKDIHFSNNQARQQKLDINQQIEEDLKICDFVRILRDKKLFEKGQKNYTKNVYKIIKKENNNFILRKYKDGKLLDKEVKKTTQYLVRINIFDLIQNIKQKKEISKKEVKKQTIIEKRLKIEGITQKNIIEYEKYLDDFQPNDEQPEVAKPKIDKFLIAESLSRENKLKQANDQLEKKDTENRLLKSQSHENLQQYKSELEKQDMELYKKQQQLSEIKQEKIDLLQKHQESEHLNWESLNKPADKARIFKEFKKLDYDKALKFVLLSQNQKYSNQFKDLSYDDLNKFFNKNQQPKFDNRSQERRLQYKFLIQTKNLLQFYYQELIKLEQGQSDDEQEQSQDEQQQSQNESEQSQNESDEESEEEEIYEQKDKNQQEIKQLEKEIDQIKQKFKELKHQKEQFPDDEDVINNEINNLFIQKGALKNKYEEISGQKYLGHKEEKIQQKKQKDKKNKGVQLQEIEQEDESKQNLFDKFNSIGKKKK